MEGIGPVITSEDTIAIRIFNALQNGMGGVDWAGLPWMADLYGVEDLDDITERLIVIKTHEPPKAMGK